MMRTTALLMLLAACAGDTDTDTSPDVDTEADSDTEADTEAQPTQTVFRGTSAVTGPNVRVGFQLTYALLQDDDLAVGPFLGSVAVGSDGSWAVAVDDEPDEEVVWNYSSSAIFDHEGDGEALIAIPLLFRDVDGDEYWSSADEIIDARMDLWILFVDTPPNDSWERGWTLAEPDLQYDGEAATQVDRTTSIDFIERWTQHTVTAEVAWTGTSTSDLRIAGFHAEDLENAIEYNSDGELVTEPAFDVAFLGGSATIALSEPPTYLDGYLYDTELEHTWVLPFVYADTNRDNEMGLFENTYDEVAAATVCADDVPTSFWYVANPYTPNGLLQLTRWNLSPGWYLNEAESASSSWWLDPPDFSSSDPTALTSNPATCDYYEVIP